MNSRPDRVAEALRERNIDAMLVASPANLRWLTGFSGSNGAALIGGDVRLFFTDFRYVEQAAEQVDGFEVVRSGRNLLGDVAERLSGRIGFEDAILSVRGHTRLTQAAPEAELVGASGTIEQLREVKDERELSAMRAAAAIADRALERLVERGIDGRTEKRVAADLEADMRALGAEDRSFAVIAASGPRGALPHAQPRDVRIERGTLMVIDLGCVVDGYCSDATRTFATGPVGDREREIYDLVATAQDAALQAIRPGADARAVDRVARDLIAEAGYADKFGHGLGHGVGLEVHEGPRLAQTAEGLLQAGNTVTVEPGVYLPGAFGVRIEDLVVVSAAGSEALTGFTKELVALS